MRSGRRRAKPGAFPYWRSVWIASSLIAGLMLFWAASADPLTGVFANPMAAGLAFLAVIAMLPIVFYADYRTQSKGRARRHPSPDPLPGSAVRGPLGVGGTGRRTAGFHLAGD